MVRLLGLIKFASPTVSSISLQASVEVVAERFLGSPLFLPATIAAVHNFRPTLFPFFAPSERAVTYRTNFGGQISFSYPFHSI
jgi:hypothetical protein